MTTRTSIKTVLLATPASDCHVVANKLLEFVCQKPGYKVHNFGVCTPTEDIVAAAKEYHPTAILVSSQNGHALTDLASLHQDLQAVGLAHIPVYAGGNLSVGANKNPQLVREQFQAIGISVLDSFDALRPLLVSLAHDQVGYAECETGEERAAMHLSD